MSLDEIMNRVAADKGSNAHNYAVHYERHFDAPIRERGGTLVEIGICGGYSLRAWREWAPNARIIGVDTEARFAQAAAAEGAEAYHGDGTKHPFWNMLHDKGVDPDVVVDDGSHFANQQKAAFDLVFPRLKSGAIYAIEDLHATYWPEPYHRIGGGSVMPFLMSLVDRLNNHGSVNPKGHAVANAMIKAVHFYTSVVFIEKV